VSEYKKPRLKGEPESEKIQARWLNAQGSYVNQIFGMLEKGGAPPKPPKVLRQKKIDIDRLKTLIKKKKNYKESYDEALDNYFASIISATNLKMPDVRSHTRKIKEPSDNKTSAKTERKIRIQLRSLIAANDTKSLRHYMANLPSDIRGLIHIHGLNDYSKHTFSKFGQNTLADVRRREEVNENYKLACFLVECGATNSTTEVPRIITIDIPREVKDEISRIGFGQWCQARGFRYANVVRSVRGRNSPGGANLTTARKAVKKASIRPNAKTKLRRVQLNKDEPPQKKGPTVDRWVQSHETLIRIYRQFDTEIENKNAKSLLSFFRQNDSRLKSARQLLEDLSKRPEFSKKVNFEKFDRLLRIYELWKMDSHQNIGSELLYFKWPSTEISAFEHAMTDLLIDQGENLLTRFGYRVGKSRGEPENLRRKILDRIYGLPEHNFERVVSNVGPADSCYRLRRIVRAIVYLIRLNQKKRADLSVALSHWQTDLRYLKRKYYDGQCDEKWIWNTEID
jgi:hypothetical protein